MESCYSGVHFCGDIEQCSKPHEVSRTPQFSTPSVCYIAQCLLKDLFTLTSCKGGGAATFVSEAKKMSNKKDRLRLTGRQSFQESLY